MRVLQVHAPHREPGGEDAVVTAEAGRVWPGIRHACYRGSRVQSSVASAAQLVGRRAGVWPDDVTLFLAPTTLVRDLHLGAGLAADSVVVKPHFVVDPGPRPRPPSA